MSDEKLQPSADLQGQVHEWQAEWIRTTLRYVVWIGLLMAFVGSYSSYSRGIKWAVPYYFTVWVLSIFVAYWSKATYRLQIYFLLFALYSLAIVVFVSGGLGDSSRLYLLVLLFVSGLLLPSRGTWFSIGVVTLTMAVLAWAFVRHRITGYTDIVSTDPLNWLALSLEMVGLGSFVALVVNHFVRQFTVVLEKDRELMGEIQMQQAAAEKEIERRTLALSRRNEHLSALAQVARDAAEIHDLDELLDRVVHLIAERFGFYHVGIFLLSDDGEWAVLKAASSSGGKRMLERGHRLRVGQEGTVGYVVAHGEARVSANVGEDAVFFNNPDLPETRSVATLPLRARQEILGALDVQSTEPTIFDEEEVSVLQLLADLIAVAIDNALLFKQAQESLTAERRAYGELTWEAWRELIRGGLRQQYDPLGIIPQGEVAQNGSRLAMQRGEIVTGETAQAFTLSAPIKERGRVIGVLEAYKTLEKGAWTRDEISLLETLTTQLSESLESARLYQESQRRALQEKLVGDITSAMRESLDVKTVIQTAARNIGKSLGLSELIVRLGTADAFVRPASMHDEPASAGIGDEGGL